MTCPTCNGTGKVCEGDEGYVLEVRCSDCGGKGKVADEE